MNVFPQKSEVIHAFGWDEMGWLVWNREALRKPLETFPKISGNGQNITDERTIVVALSKEGEEKRKNWSYSLEKDYTSGPEAEIIKFFYQRPAFFIRLFILAEKTLETYLFGFMILVYIEHCHEVFDSSAVQDDFVQRTLAEENNIDLILIFHKLITNYYEHCLNSVSK